MANASVNPEQKYTLNGIERNAPIEWADVSIKAEYENDAVQPSISVDSLSFTLDAREAILQWIANGRIYEGMPIALTVFNINSFQANFNGFLDFSEQYEDLPDDGLLKVGLRQTDGLDSFFNLVETVSFGYMENQGHITGSDYVDLDYVVQKKFNVIEIVATSLVIYVLIKELREAIARTQRDVAQIASYLASGITGSVGAALYTVAATDRDWET